MKAKKFVLLTILMTLLLTGCGNTPKEVDDVAPEDIITEETKEPELEEPAESLNKEEIVTDDILKEEPEKEPQLPDVTKDYNEKDYMKYPIKSVYFLEKDGYGYELVIAQTDEEEGWLRDVKVFVSKESDGTFCLQQVMDNESHTGGAWDSKGLYLTDVNFDGEDDIIVQNGHYGSHGTVFCTCYLGSNKTYERCESFEDIPNASIDAVNKTILGTSTNSATSHSYYVYKFKNGAFRLKRMLTEDYELKEEELRAENPNGYENYIRRYTIKDGKDNVLKEFTSEEKGESYIENNIYGSDSYWQLDDYNGRWNPICK